MTEAVHFKPEPEQDFSGFRQDDNMVRLPAGVLADRYCYETEPEFRRAVLEQAARRILRPDPRLRNGERL